jgi:hypothetical protein
MIPAIGKKQVQLPVVSSSLRHVHFPNESSGAGSHPEAKHVTFETV